MTAILFFDRSKKHLLSNAVTEKTKKFGKKESIVPEINDHNFNSLSFIYYQKCAPSYVQNSFVPVVPDVLQGRSVFQHHVAYLFLQHRNKNISYLVEATETYCIQL
jgi:hypothetical protein